MQIALHLFAERAYLTKLEKAFEKMVQDLQDEFGDEGKPRYLVDREIKKRKDLSKLKDNIELQKDLINYLEDACKILSNFGFSVKNSVELMKLM